MYAGLRVSLRSKVRKSDGNSDVLAECWGDGFRADDIDYALALEERENDEELLVVIRALKEEMCL